MADNMAAEAIVIAYGGGVQAPGKAGANLAYREVYEMCSVPRVPVESNTSTTFVDPRRRNKNGQA